MEQLKINELIREIKNNHEYDYSKVSIDALCDYSDNTYICDAIMEIWDNNIDIYYYDLFEWAKDNFSYIEDANNEYEDIDPDITKQIQGGQYYANNEYCYENITDMLLIYCYDLFQKQGIEVISDDMNEKIIEYVEQLDYNEYLPSIDDIHNTTAPEEVFI